MHHTRSGRLEPLQQLASQREEEAMRTLAGSRQHAAAQEARLHELQRYIEEYSNSVPENATPALLGNRHAFLSRLREAETFQRRALEQAQAKSEVERARYLLKRRDTKTLDQLAASYRAQEQKQALHREQKEFDEIAQRRTPARSHETSD